MNDSKPARPKGIPDEPFVPADIAIEGRGATRTMVGEWVAMAPVSHLATRVYWLLRAHCNHTRAGAAAHRAFPSQKRLAAMCGLKRPEQIAAAVKELVGIGAVDVAKERYAGDMRQHCVYTVHQDPPEGYEGWTNTNDFVGPDENPQVARTPDISGVGVPDEPGRNQTKHNQDKKEDSSASRHHAAARRTRGQAEAIEHRQRCIVRKSTQARRAWEIDQVSSSWLTLENPYLVEDIDGYVDLKWGSANNIRNLIHSMVGRNQRDGTPVPPMKVLNAALKEARWDDEGIPEPLNGTPDAPFVPVLAVPFEERWTYQCDDGFENDPRVCPMPDFDPPAPAADVWSQPLPLSDPWSTP